MVRVEVKIEDPKEEEQTICRLSKIIRLYTLVCTAAGTLQLPCAA